MLFFLVHFAVRRLLRLLAGGSAVAALELENAVLRLPAQYEAYAEHDEQDSGQEEVYTLLKGSALLVGGEEHPLRPGVFARVGPTVRRKIVTDDEPALLLCLGGVRGEVYDPPSWTDPTSVRPDSAR